MFVVKKNDQYWKGPGVGKYAEYAGPEEAEGFNHKTAAEVIAQSVGGEVEELNDEKKNL